jgi:hypothetical protein
MGFSTTSDCLWALAFKIGTFSDRVADAVALVSLAEAADWASGDQLSGD